MDYEITTLLSRDLKVKPDQSSLPFGKYFTDHMFRMDYENGQWVNPRITPYKPVEMDPASMVFHYGQAVFEGMKAYRAEDGSVKLFRPEANFKRLNASDERMCIPHLDEELLMCALKELLKIEADWIPTAPNTSLYIRPFVIATEPMLGVHPSKSYIFMIILSPVGPYYPTGLAPVEILIEDEYVRAVRGGIGFAKSSANYAISMKGQQKAIQKGYAQVLWLDGVERKYVEEMGAMNAFFKIEGELVTPELNGSILPGITRDSIIKLARSWGITVTERKISVDEIVERIENGTLEEAFGAGTAAVISPVGKFALGDKELVINGGKTGPLSQRLYDGLTGIQYGRLEDEFGWTVTL